MSGAEAKSTCPEIDYNGNVKKRRSAIKRGTPFMKCNFEPPVLIDVVRRGSPFSQWQRVVWSESSGLSSIPKLQFGELEEISLIHLCTSL
ncbi:hypothetical protein CEXT_487261 [Caerostris extrusa]|uniref:Uncharacterized protein n=1 Tax=Caerostris extrusa TaxID=172846 RepID=A0AAV4T6E4_CAEEX|nr:hypothetical protein CEXT_487261 [Caerostris extrusa]